MASYKDQYLNALRYLGELYPEAFLPEEDLAGISETIDYTRSKEGQVLYSQGRPVLAAFAKQWLATLPHQIEHNCHALAGGFLKVWERFELARAMPLAVTIGNVYYKGRNIYGTSREAIADVLRAGHSNTPLELHVWLTVDDMTVLDLGIKHTLAAMGLRSPVSGNEQPVLIWQESSPGAYQYEPLLINNEFFRLVDAGEFRNFLHPLR